MPAAQGLPMPAAKLTAELARSLLAAALCCSTVLMDNSALDRVGRGNTVVQSLSQNDPQGAGRQIIHSDYTELMRQRALGQLPDMGCAIRIGEIIRDIAPQVTQGGRIEKLLDIGCATGHYYRTFTGMGIPIREYVGLEIDTGMIDAATRVWEREIAQKKVRFVLDDIESPTPLEKCDVLICANSFMYYKSAKRVLAKFLDAAKHIVIRSYFAESNFRIIRGQSAQNNDRVQIDELDLFTESGDIVIGDFWNIYGFTYIEKLVRRLSREAKVEWLKDLNKIESMAEEADLGVVKRGGTQVIGGYEISYPLLQPWEILVISSG
jgi:SAM-dependent methyltransferase